MPCCEGNEKQNCCILHEMESSVFDLNVPDTMKFSRRGHLLSSRERKFLVDCRRKFVYLGNIARGYNQRFPNDIFASVAAHGELTRKCFDNMLKVNQTTFFVFQFNEMITDYETMLDSVLTEIRKIGLSRVLMY